MLSGKWRSFCPGINELRDGSWLAGSYDNTLVRCLDTGKQIKARGGCAPGRPDGVAVVTPQPPWRIVLVGRPNAGQESCECWYSNLVTIWTIDLFQISL